jgi:hypothetical protein
MIPPFDCEEWMSMRAIIQRNICLAAVLVLLVTALPVRAQTGQQPQPSTQASAAPTTGNEVNVKAARKAQVRQLAVDGKYGEAYALGKQLLTEEPEDLRTLLSVSWSAMYMVTGGTPLNNAEATGYAQRALQLIHEGKTPEENKPLSTEAKEQILGWLEYALGIFVLKTEPEQAIGYLTIAAQSEGFQKYDPQTYALLALAYDGAEYARRADEYRKRFTSPKQRETPEGQAAMAKIITVIDRMIDAYARAVALSGDNPLYAQKKVEWMKLLSGFYRFRRGSSEAGLNEMIAGVLDRPLGTAMNEPVGAAKPVAANPTAAPQGSQPSATPPSASTATLAPQSRTQSATAQGSSSNVQGSSSNVRAPAKTAAGTTSVAQRSSPEPAPSPRKNATPSSAASATPSRLDPMFFSTWAYYLTMSTSNGNNASPIGGTLKLSGRGSAFEQDLRVPLAQTSLTYKYSGTFSIDGSRLSFVYRDAQGATKTDIYDFIFSPELKALRLTRNYGSASTSWILLLKGTENVSRCTEQGKAALGEAVCRQIRKAV